MLTSRLPAAAMAACTAASPNMDNSSGPWFTNSVNRHSRTKVVCDRSSLEVNKYYQETMKRKFSHVIKLARKNKNTISKT